MKIACCEAVNGQKSIPSMTVQSSSSNSPATARAHVSSFLFKLKHKSLDGCRLKNKAIELRSNHIYCRRHRWEWETPVVIVFHSKYSVFYDDRSMQSTSSAIADAIRNIFGACCFRLLLLLLLLLLLAASHCVPALLSNIAIRIQHADFHLIETAHDRIRWFVADVNDSASWPVFFEH